MSWDCRLSRLAVKQLKRLPRHNREQISRSIGEITNAPASGDVRPIRAGKFRGTLRKRVGSYRIIFTINANKLIVEIAAILFRTDTTYN